MVRTQVQLDEGVYEEVRRIAYAERMSISALLREMIRDGLLRRTGKRSPDLSKIAGIGDSGVDDISERHDHYLVEDLAE